MHQLITTLVVVSTALVWVGGGLYFAGGAARERAKEAGGPWLRHLTGKGWRQVQSAKGRTCVNRADLWGLAGVGVFLFVLPMFLALLDAILGP